MTATATYMAGERNGMTSATRVFRTSLLEAAQRHENLAAGFLLLVFTLLAAWDLVAGGIVVGKDTVTQYYPWYTYLGESLRSGEIPGWNPYQFSGVPFAADPLSGWTYLPAMVLFTILPVSAAAAAYMFVHLLLAGLFTYTLARVLHINLAGALLAAVAYEFNGFMYWRNACCSPYAAVMTWLPLAVLGAELAIRSSRWLDRALWWGVGGLGLSQILAAWPGQGSYYALLALGGYVACRTLLIPPGNVSSIRGRTLGFLLNGGGVLLFGFGLAAAGLLPRLEYHALSSLADGYGAIEGVRAAWGGWTAEDWKRLLVPGLIYPGLAILALALAAPFIARGRHGTPYFALLVVCTLILAGKSVTPLHRVLYDVLPGFEWIHPHGPARIKVILYLGLVLLAGATLSRLGERSRETNFLVTLPILTSLSFVASGAAIPAVTLLALAVAKVCLVIYVLSPQGRRMAALLLVLVVFVDLFATDRAILAERATAETGKQLVRIDLARYYEPTGAARFLRSETNDAPARYFGFGPHQHGEKRTVHLNNYFDEPDTTALLASNLGTSSGLQSIQGYNAVHIARYDEYIKALNGAPQGYHNTDIVPQGLDSPLLDLLNVRYIVVPAVAQPDQNVLRELKDTHPTVYGDDRVDVLENRDALPRAWIVHAAKRVAPQETLKSLKSGEVDPARTALLERPPPALSPPDDPSTDRALVETYEANRITLHTSTGAPGLLVISEIYYPAWKAYVNGRTVPLYVADHVLRAVPVPAGEHTVELRYESWSLRGGLAISLVSYLLLIALVVATLRRRGSRKIPAEMPTGRP
jgi:Bacterial membrane protein YfhO